MNPLTVYGERARDAAIAMQGLGTARKNEALERMAALLEEETPAILQANAADVRMACEEGRNAAFIDRLMLDAGRMRQVVACVRKVASLPDPSGRILEEWSRPNGLIIRKVSVPIGVIGFIYESRGTVTCDAASLCVKAGNAVILRGGKESRRTNEVMIGAIRRALVESGLPEDAVQLVAGGGRDEVRQLCELEDYVHVLIPRGGKGLVSAVSQYARMPVLKHLDGICHTYVDASARLEMALDICDDAKTQRPGVCNAMETLLVCRNIASEFLPRLAARMERRGVELRGCPESLPLLGNAASPASEEDWRTEYEDLILSVCIVDGLDAAISHINRYGSHHSDAIVTEDAGAVKLFMTMVDSACVYHNCSTRFSDGEEFGFGAEIGIGTGKLHARGPMGLRELTTYKYEIEGSGQLKDHDRVRGME